ncbi:hypothetical protein [Streptomyces sp. NPDC021139]|uniref:hypothetical protein n=1 Tax=unclassified Streptomyces TaxID=2593676 RepID=UPI0033FF342C
MAREKLARTGAAILLAGIASIAISNAPVQAASSDAYGGHDSLRYSASASVNYAFPDGSRQTVSTTVANVLDKAFNGSNATSAWSAYSPRWVSIDPSTLKTGDMIKWANYSAVSVVINGRIKAVVSGRMESFNSSAHGGLVGLYHPSV